MKGHPDSPHAKPSSAAFSPVEPQNRTIPQRTRTPFLSATRKLASRDNAVLPTPSNSPVPLSLYKIAEPFRDELRFVLYPSFAGFLYAVELGDLLSRSAHGPSPRRTSFTSFELAVLLCSPFLLPTHLAWHSLGLKPCALRRPPFCFALTNARPAGFGSPVKIAKRSQKRLPAILPVPPKKHACRLGSSSLSLFKCPSQTGRKGVTNACTSIA